MFRALGGDGGLEVCAVDATAHGAQRGLLQRVAGIGEKVELAWRDERALRLPPVIDCFPESDLNRDLYLWLSALAINPSSASQSWLTRSQWMTRIALARFPGLTSRYRRLVNAHLVLRPDPGACRQAGRSASAPSTKRSPNQVV